MKTSERVRLLAEMLNGRYRDTQGPNSQSVESVSLDLALDLNDALESASTQGIQLDDVVRSLRNGRRIVRRIVP